MQLTLLTDRVIVATNPGEQSAFANTLPDNDDGILINDGYCRIPVYNPNTGNVEFSMFGLRINAYDLPVGTPITCLVEPGSRGRWHAVAWAPAGFYSNANKMFEVCCQEGDNEPEMVWSGTGVLELSKHFASERWESDGTIWRSPNGGVMYWIDEIIRKKSGELDITPAQDPRIPAHNLPVHFMRSHLPRPRDEYRG